VGSNNAEEEYSTKSARKRAEAWKLSDGADIEYALGAAEYLLWQAEERRRHEQNVRVGIWTTLAFVSLSLGSSVFALIQVVVFNHDAPEILAALAGVIVTSAVMVIIWRSLRRQQRRISLDYTLRIATQLSAMINEALVDVAEREKWSYLRLQATKLRLSAFPLHDPSGKRYYRRDE
jgi:hypothetical protein